MKTIILSILLLLSVEHAFAREEESEKKRICLTTLSKINTFLNVENERDLIRANWQLTRALPWMELYGQYGCDKKKLAATLNNTPFLNP